MIILKDDDNDLGDDDYNYDDHDDDSDDDNELDDKDQICNIWTNFQAKSLIFCVVIGLDNT